jgi:pyruvate/2-oxoglutarate dehydrogenase complex dihydrolipoamide dehydrogenase (E3) component
VERKFDVVVIGAGPAGEVVAGRLADRSDKRIAIVERELVGGECSFYACMPSKALLRPAEILREVRRVPGAAEAVTGQLKVEAALTRRDEAIAHLDDEHHVPWLVDRGITLVRGDAQLAGQRRVRVGGDVLVARDAVVIAVGSGALFPPIPGLAEAGAWSNRQMTTASSAPPRLTILGGGVVGVEMAQAWASLGSRVTLIEAFERLLMKEEPFVSEQVREALVADGVEVLCGHQAASVTREGEQITVHLLSGEAIAGDRLLVAVGRRALTDGLGLEKVGLEGGGFIEVNEHLQVPMVPWLYALGDVNGRSLLTHSGKYQARIAADHILGIPGARARTDHHGAPRVVFTDPQVAAVGMTLEAAEQAGHQVEAIDLATESTPGASFVGKGGAGTTRFVVDTERQVLLGVTFVGPEVADMLQAASFAVIGAVPLSTLAHAVAAFPTRSELWLKFLEAYEQRHGITLHASS